jgi:spore coat polysaccharide biosynthesis predicted glycosyltransferase SpsG
MSALAFRCDENSETGLGHFARCRDLGRLLRRELPSLRVVFAGDLSDFSRPLLAALGFEHLPLAPDEALVSPRLRAALGPETRLMLDSYRLDDGALAELEGYPAPWGCFDDFGASSYAEAGLVINGRVSAQAESYRSAQVLVGPQYFPATPELARAREQRVALPRPTEPKQALVFVGGHDRTGVGPELARAASEAFGSARVLLVQAQPWADPGSSIRQLPLGPGLDSLLATSDLVIAGGGRLKYEAGYCQVPCASVSQTEGQAEDTSELAQRGLCVDLGMAAGFERSRGVEQLRALWRTDALDAMRAAQARVFPADAPARLARAVSSALSLA